MPRRIRLDFDDTKEGECDLGINYAGAWRHPLSPYREQQKGEAIPEHPQPGGITYRHWLGLIFAELDGKQRLTPAIVVRWCDGYDIVV